LHLPLFAASSGAKAPDDAQPMTVDIAQTVVTLPLAKGVLMDDAVESMKCRANKLNFKPVAEVALSRRLQAMGEK